MAGAVVTPGEAAPRRRARGGVADKGLRRGAIGFVSSVVIGVASTAPGYSLAATLGLIVAAVGFQAPAVLWVAFIPMLCIASAYLYMNRTDPDCGTTFAWVSKAMGPWAGWLGGWAIIVADIVVMANLAQIAGLYSFKLFGWESAAGSVAAVTAVGVVWIVVMTAITTIGIELSARTQWSCSSAEVVTLGLFAVVALVRVYSGDALAGSEHPQLSWFSPFAIDGGTRGADDRRPARRLHLLGLGQRGQRQRGDREPERGARPLGGRVDDPARRHLRPRRDGRDRVRRHGEARRRGRRAGDPRHRRPRRHVRQPADHRRADVGGGLDADDDPADGAHDAVDGALRARCPPASASCTRAS